jgi:lipoate-protein ligase A
MMMQTWRFIDTGSHEAAWNMALDEVLFLSHEDGRVPPTLRVYAWRTPTLSLGYAQDATAEVDLAACQAHGVTVVRRPTGGRAVLHDQEVTYSVVMPVDVAAGPRTLTEHYHLIGKALAAALAHLGVPVHLARPQVHPATRHAGVSPACFSALSRYELSVAGKKLVGSAQKRGQQALLQHGSIPLWMDRERLFACLQVPPERRPRLIQEAYHTMVAVNEVVPTPVTPPALHAALRMGFAQACGVQFVGAVLGSEEWQVAAQLQATKYATEAWNLRGAAAWRHGREERVDARHTV